MLLYLSHFFSDYIYLDSHKGFCGKYLNTVIFLPKSVVAP